MASLDLYTGLLSVTAAAPPAYNATPITATVFANATLITQNGGVSMSLNDSVVTASDNSAAIVLGTTDRRNLVAQIYASGNYTPMTLTFGGVPVPVAISCSFLGTC